MWESLPIQRIHDKGDDFHFIEREKEYPLFYDVHFCRWIQVPRTIQKWCFSIWKDEFLIQRNPVADNDLLFWIPQKGVLLAKYGCFIGDGLSREMIYVCYNFVNTSFRGEGVSRRLILTMANVCKTIFGPITFMFELRNVPISLSDAIPYAKFHYVWIPFLQVSSPPKWKRIKSISFLKNHDILGFHSTSWKGYRVFEHCNHRIVFDPSNDIVYYDDYLSLTTFDGMNIPGSYCRVFNPFGDRVIFIQNMHFSSRDYFKHILLV